MEEEEEEELEEGKTGRGNQIVPRMSLTFVIVFSYLSRFADRNSDGNRDTHMREQ